MITQALQHCRGIGPARLARLQGAGVCTWQDVLNDPQRIPAGWRAALVEESRRCLAALEGRDIRYFVEQLAAPDKWRILAHFLNETSYFDIETMGLEYDAPITVIACWHRGQLHTFAEHENLDEFLDLLDDVQLLASFNGSSFDVPRVLDAFHIPQLPCPHLDLRWTCHHQGLTGGLKRIAASMGIQRPIDLSDADGEMAVQLWHAWRDRGDRPAREQLIRYCAADVLQLVVIAQQLSGQRCWSAEQTWSYLPAGAAASRHPGHQSGFGAAGPSRLRARRRLVG